MADPAPIRLFAGALLVLAYALMCVAVWRRHRERVARAQQDVAALAPGGDGHQPVLVAYASQTGHAEELAWETARILGTAGLPARVCELGRLQAVDLGAASRALFIASTYGEGDAPDNAALFASRVMTAAADLGGLRYALIALGDSSYRHFCGFGRELDAWLQANAAQPLFDRIELDDGGEDGQGGETARLRWQRQLGHVAGLSDAAADTAHGQLDALAAQPASPGYGAWTLAARRQLNPGSLGGPTFHVELAWPGPQPAPAWEAGDLVQVRAPGDPRHPREYSIACAPAAGRLHLLVRQERKGDGSLGVASGWLTAQCEVGAGVELRVRAHRNFRLGDNAARPLLLVGNGTGMAALRAHLQARAAAGQGPNWLVFGERQAECDFYFRVEVQAWAAAGLLRLDTAFSRDGAGRIYVQDVLRREAAGVRAWIAEGGAVYVCGSLQGMAGGVHAALGEILGAPALEQLIREGRLRRDVY